MELKVHNPEHLPCEARLDPLEQQARDLLFRAEVGGQTVAGRIFRHLWRSADVEGKASTSLAELREATEAGSDSSLRKALDVLQRKGLVHPIGEGRRVGSFRLALLTPPKRQALLPGVELLSEREPPALGIVEDVVALVDEDSPACQKVRDVEASAPKVRTESAHQKCASQDPPPQDVAEAHQKCAPKVRTAAGAQIQIQRKKETNKGGEEEQQQEKPPPDEGENAELLERSRALYRRIDPSHYPWVALQAELAIDEGNLDPDALEELVARCAGGENFASELKCELGAAWLSLRGLKRALQGRGIRWQRRFERALRPRGGPR